MSGDLIELVHDERLEESEILSFEIPASSPKAYLLGADVEVRWRDRRFYIAEIEENRDRAEATISVEAEALWYRLGDITYVGSFILTDQTPRAGLIAIVAAVTGWTVDEGTTLSTDTFSIELQDKTILEILRTWAKVTGKFLIFDTLARSIRLADTRGRDLGLGFRYRRNVKSVRRRVRPPAVTVLYAYGRDDLSIAGANGGAPFVEDFTFYTAQGITLDEARALYTRSRVWSDDSFVDEAPLLAAAEAMLADLSQAVVTYEMDVVDLSELTGIDELPIAVGDTVRVNDPTFGTDLRTTVVRYERHPNDPKRNRVELAYLPKIVDDPSSSSGRSNTAVEWIQFLGQVTADFEIRNDGTYTIARIPLRFSSGGRANYHLELTATGVDAGTMFVEIFEAQDDVVAWKSIEVPYTNGETVRAVLSWASEELTGSKDYRVRVRTEATGGADPAKGVDIAIDSDDPIEASFWILAQGAVRETPVEPNSVTYNYTGAIQSFTVPDNVTEIEVVAKGGSGGDFNQPGGNGEQVSARFAVIPGAQYDVIVGGRGQDAGTNPGWPNGGTGGTTISSSVGAGGGGATWLVATGGAMTSALIVAGAGGGAGLIRAGGAAGFHAGSPGADGQSGGGQGATQFAGGAGGTSGGGSVGEAGDVDGVGQGGDGAAGGGSLGYGGGGGGGGWHGGGGAGSTGSFGGDHGGGGGGGSGYVDPSGFDLAYSDGSNNGHGQVVISWETPVI